MVEAEVRPANERPRPGNVYKGEGRAGTQASIPQTPMAGAVVRERPVEATAPRWRLKRRWPAFPELFLWEAAARTSGSAGQSLSVASFPFCFCSSHHHLPPPRRDYPPGCRRPLEGSESSVVALIVHIIAVNNILPIVHSHSHEIKRIQCRIVQSVVTVVAERPPSW